MKQHILNATGAAVGAFLGFCMINTNAFVEFTWARWNTDWVHIGRFNSFNFFVFVLVLAMLIGAMVYVIRTRPKNGR